ncbi:hypothetical protein CLOM_g23538 [Closterium sp. NIES-68]|nr:hypothetical protein CLOM_g23538 [Closterium sp. NIES-68]GJP61352.1 hypothetical protein CLOP_g18523 [Closterium sp. NIES-67]GJP65964.1 hypothetical protein CLOP_g22854 [Closterium sp. NIES-67]
MASDGGPVTASISVTPADVDKAADEILVYWFGDFMAPGYAGPPPADDDVAAKQPLWFRKDADVDAFISARFAPLIPLAASGQLAGWEDTPRGALALVVLLDQFTRNSFRGSPDSFAQDVLARDVAKRAIAKGFNTQFHLRIRSFFYMPFMHSEDLPDQDLCVQLFLQSVAEAPEGPLKESLAQWVQFAHKHRDIIVKFGRFPHRNEVLGRESTAEEVEHVATHGGF